MDLLLKNPKYFFDTYFNFSFSAWVLAFLLLISIDVIWICSRRNRNPKKFFTMIHAFFGATLFGITLFNNNRVGVQDIMINPWDTISQIRTEQGVHIVRAVASNVCLFVPIGVFSRLYLEKNSYLRAGVVGVSVSLVIEILQYICQRGTLESLDVICNVCGAYLGVFLAEIISISWRKIRCLYLQGKR